LWSYSPFTSLFSISHSIVAFSVGAFFLFSSHLSFATFEHLEKLMRIYLADLAHTQSVPDSALTVPLNIAYIKAYAQEHLGEDVEIRLFKHPEKLLQAVYETKPDVFGLANYGWNEQLNLTVGHFIRKSCPETLIVAGGPNIDPDAAMIERFLMRHSYLDFVVEGGGEEPFVELIEMRQEDPSLAGERPQNLHWLNEGKLMSTPRRTMEKNITNIPSPYLNGHVDEFLDLGMVPMFETNRGCPFHCTFCAWGMASQDVVRRMDLDMALKEIYYVGERSRSRKWIFCDANFGLLKRDIEIAEAIKKVHDQTGFPKNCQLWTAKNVTDRNLEVGEILGDMITPVMAVQSLDEAVLEKIKRSNISTDTYLKFQQAFREIGSRTYSDLIVPLPMETLDSHLEALSQLVSFGVDIIQSHNMRLLAGAETNLPATRNEYAFETKYRLIHGDAGIYKSPDGSELRCFEYEESIRSTTTMSEADLFYLRKLHFLVDFAWNNEVYKPLLKTLQAYGGKPIALLNSLIIENAEEGIQNGLTPDVAEKLCSFWSSFDKSSREEWFDTEQDIVEYFAKEESFQRLMNQEFDKLNILYAFVLLKNFKAAFDEAFKVLALEEIAAETNLIDKIAELSFRTFPSLEENESDNSTIVLPRNYIDLTQNAQPLYSPDKKTVEVSFEPPETRPLILELLNSSKQIALSKLINVQGLSIRGLKYSVVETG